MVKKTLLMKGKTVIPGRFFAIYHDAAFDVAFLALGIASNNPWTFWEELKMLNEVTLLLTVLVYLRRYM